MQARLESVRSTSRRTRVLWTLYLSFAYLIYAIVLILVVGRKNLGPWDWTGIAVGPVLIYGTRTVISAIFTFRIESLSAKLKDQQTERAKTIQKLKDATKYDSTLELLEKYGGPENKPSKNDKKGGAADEDGGDQVAGKQSRQSIGTGTPGRTTLPPPPTANIPRGDARQPLSAPGTPQPGLRSQLSTPQQRQHHREPINAMAPSAEFAPNAYGPEGPPPAQHYDIGAYRGGDESHWYDRILDLLLGEDETAPKNRIVLICKQCRLVNGQAPPGTKALSEIGTWKCMACGAVNGEMDEGTRIVKEVLGESSKKTKSERAGIEEIISQVDNNDGSSDLVEVEKEDEPDKDEDAIEVDGKGASQGDQTGLRKRKGKGKK